MHPGPYREVLGRINVARCGNLPWRRGFSGTRTTRIPGNDISTSGAGLERSHRSAIVKIRLRRPPARASLTKSIVYCSSGPQGQPEQKWVHCTNHSTAKLRWTALWLPPFWGKTEGNFLGLNAMPSSHTAKSGGPL